MNERENYKQKMEICNQRLLKFADAISGIVNHPEHLLTDEANIVVLMNGLTMQYKLIYHPWVFDELVDIDFDIEWYFDEFTGRPLYEGCDPEDGTVGAVADFFCLSADDLLELFNIEFTDDHGPQIATSIVELVKRRRKK